MRYVVGNSHKALVPQFALDTTHGQAEIFCSDIFLERELKPASHVGSGVRTRAIVKVQDSCNANCSFCVIPSVRGRSRSIDPDSALQEIRQLVARGYKEVVLSGIHLGTYGRDLTGKITFHALIVRVLEIPGLERLRLSSIEPLEVAPETLRTLISAKNEAFRRDMIGREIDVLTLEEGSAISSNFVRVRLPAGVPVNQWTRVLVTDINDDGVQAVEKV